MLRPRTVLTGLLVAAVVLSGCTSYVNDLSGRPSNEWAADMIGASAAHDQGLTGRGVKVAVVDTGVMATHPEFAGMPGNITWGDVINGRDRPYDNEGHGTHVSGIVVAQPGNPSFQTPIVQGAAPGAELIHVKAIAGGTRSQGSDGDVARAIDMAVDAGAHVLILSLGSEPGLLPIGRDTEASVDRAIDRGVVVVAAAGNAGEGQSGSNCDVKSPASMRRVIAVAAVDRDKTIASFSCRGDNSGGPLGLDKPQDPNRKPELSAPGVSVIGPWPQRDCGGQVSDYCQLSGTSQAAPYVGAAVAILLQANPELKRQGPDAVDQVKRALVQSAETVQPSSGHHDRYGYGLVRVDRALDRLGGGSGGGGGQEDGVGVPVPTEMGVREGALPPPG